MRLIVDHSYTWTLALSHPQSFPYPASRNSFVSSWFLLANSFFRSFAKSRNFANRIANQYSQYLPRSFIERFVSVEKRDPTARSQSKQAGRKKTIRNLNLARNTL